MENKGGIDDSDCGIAIPETGELSGSDCPFTTGMGDALIRKIDFSGIRLLYGKLKFIRPVPVQVLNDSPYIEMYFSLSGCRDVFFPSSTQRSTVSAGCHNLYYIPDNEFYIEPQDGEEESLSVQIQFTEEYFRRFMPADHAILSAFMKKIDSRELSVLNMAQQRITPEMFSLINDIVHCEKEGIIKQLSIETSALKLLLLQFEQYEASLKKTSGNIKEYDIEKLETVRQLLQENISYPHSLAELSRNAGINDFKLKKGFKELFGTTVFGYLHELRMAHAKELLHDNKKTIAEIAERCGYAYVQSFTTAFKNRYGTTPEKFRK